MYNRWATYVQILFLKPSDRFWPLNLYLYYLNPLLAHVQLILNPKIRSLANFDSDAFLHLNYLW